MPFQVGHGIFGWFFDRAQHHEACNWHSPRHATIRFAYRRLDMGHDESRRQFDRAGYHEARNWQDVWRAFTSWMAHAWACVGAYFLCGPIKAHLGREAVGPLPLQFDGLLNLPVSVVRKHVLMCLDAW